MKEGGTERGRENVGEDVCVCGGGGGGGRREGGREEYMSLFLSASLSRLVTCSTDLSANYHPNVRPANTAEAMRPT